MAKKSNTRKQVEKAVKKTNRTTIVLAVVFLIIGAIVGCIGYCYLTKNDKFELNGNKTITLDLGSDYIEQGATVISFGKDVSDKIVISGDELDTLTEGEYQLVYRIDDFRYKNYQLVRTIIVVNGGENNG